MANTTFDAADVRLTTAETRITAYDNAGIINTVSDVRLLQRNAVGDANSLLRNVLTGQQTLDEMRGAVAYARTELTAYVDENMDAEAAARLELAVAVEDNAAAILSEQTTRATETSALATDITNLGVSVSNSSAAILVEQSVRADADDALASSIAAMSSTVADNTAAILAEASTRADADTAIASTISTLSSSVTTNASAISTEATTRASADTAMASSITTLQSTVGDHTTAIQTTAETVDGISATYTVKMDNNGTMSGYGLTSTLAEGGAATSKFIASVDEFAVVAPNRTAGQLNSVPFAVLTTAQTINGVSFAPGVYIDGASINHGTIGGAQIGLAVIDNAKIVDATIDDAKINNLNASKINAGYISAARIAVNSLSGDRITAGTIDADRINADSLYAQLLYAGDAYIGDLAVNTIKIAGGAITSLTDSYLGTAYTIGGPLTFDLTYIPTGRPFMLAVECSGYSESDGHCRALIKFDGTVAGDVINYTGSGVKNYFNFVGVRTMNQLQFQSI